MTECPFCGWLERPRVYADGILRCSRCGRPVDDFSRQLDHWGSEMFSKSMDDESCPSCGGLMEGGYVVGAERIAWFKEIPEFAYFGEQLGEDAPMGVFAYPYMRALRCKSCRILRY